MLPSVRRPASLPAVLSLSVVLVFAAGAVVALVAGCGMGDAVLAPGGRTTEPPVPGAEAQSGPVSSEFGPEPRGPEPMKVTGKQRGFLDALHQAGVPASSDLEALSIGMSVCQARAARQSDQAVWDFVLPMVRSDIRTTRQAVTAPPPSEVSTATAAYVRIAPEQLC